ncbi:MAG TPA: prepilin-type N-terminal cleavage/methylation domain-containing protein [Gemmatimonadales bacterium]|jgi:prepilin-type N-terminal cleavage/methylation domain-containing protein
MTAPRAVGPRRGRAGFTLVELLISVVVAGVVLGAVAKLMRSQGGAYANQRALTDARETLRGGSVMLAWELRHAALGGSAFNVITSQSLGLRAIQGLGVACARGVVVPAGGAWTRRFALWNAGGDIEATSNDSALVFVSSTQKWQAFKVNQIGTPAGLGLPACGWTGTARAPALAVELVATTAGALSGITVGATFRMFRPVQYGEVLVAGRWWLGRKVGAAATEQLTGPLLAPAASGGLSFVYYDTLGAVTANPAAVGTVQFTMRSQSYKQYRNPNTGVVGYRPDSLTTKVALRR